MKEEYSARWERRAKVDEKLCRSTELGEVLLLFVCKKRDKRTGAEATNDEVYMMNRKDL